MGKKAIIKIRLVGAGLLIGFVIWLLWSATAPSGRASYQSNFCGHNYFISRLTPDSRVKESCSSSGVKIKIIGDPVYFNLRPLRPFQRAKLSLEYRLLNPKKTPIIEAGVLTDKKVWRYDLKPLDNEIINNLSQQWFVVTDSQGAMLLAKEKKFARLADFLANLPPRPQIALYHYDLPAKFSLPNYQPSQQGQIIETALRGPYQIYTYIKGEPLDWQFVFQDLNQNKDSDPVDIYLYFQQTLIDSRHLPDDGIAADNGLSSEPRRLKFYLADLPTGLYKLEIKVNDDIITRRIITKQSKLSWANKIWLSQSQAGSITLFTNSRQVQIKTTDPASLQTVYLGAKPVQIDKTYKQFRFSLKPASSSPLAKIVLRKGGLVLAGAGVFAFQPAAFLDPAFKKVDRDFSPAQTGVSYILAHYRQPQVLANDWRLAAAEFDLSRAYRQNGAYSFLISVPGLLAEKKAGAAIEIKSIKFDLRGKTLKEKLKEFIKRL